MPSAYGVATRRPPILLSIIGGISVIALRNNEDFRLEVNEPGSTIVGVGVAAIISGTISVLLAIGLRRGSRVARALVLIYEVLHIIGLVYAMIRLDHTTFLSSAIVSIVIAMLVIWYLYGTRGAQEFFGDTV